MGATITFLLKLLPGVMWALLGVKLALRKTGQKVPRGTTLVLIIKEGRWGDEDEVVSSAPSLSC